MASRIWSSGIEGSRELFLCAFNSLSQFFLPMQQLQPQQSYKRSPLFPTNKLLVSASRQGPVASS